MDGSTCEQPHGLENLDIPDFSIWFFTKKALRNHDHPKDTGWYYLQSRYYDPIVKRFLNADTFASTGQGFLGYNMFAYCENGPGCFKDKDGNYRTWAIQETDGYHMRHNYKKPDYSSEGWVKTKHVQYAYRVREVDEIPEDVEAISSDLFYTRDLLIKRAIQKINIHEVHVFNKTYQLFPRTSTTVYIEFQNAKIKLTISLTAYKNSDWLDALTKKLSGKVSTNSYNCGDLIPDVFFPCVR